MSSTLDAPRVCTTERVRSEHNALLCPSYHGSTLLSLLLNNHEQVSCLGDTVPGRHKDVLCACARQVSDCEFWQTIRAELALDRFSGCAGLLPALPYYGASPIVQYLGGRLLRSIEGRSRRRIGFAADRPWAAALRIQGLQTAAALFSTAGRAGVQYAELYDRFHTTVCRLHGTSTFVDGSKGMVKLLALRRLNPRIQTARVIHLVRDPRGFTASMIKRHPEWSDPMAIARLWCRLHLTIEALGSPRIGCEYQRVRYEDLASHPTPTMNKLLEFLDLPLQALCSAPLAALKHHLIGNRMLRTFRGEIRLDDSWRSRLSPAAQEAVLSVAGPLAGRYGYLSEC